MWSCQIAMQVSKLLLPLSFCAQLTVGWCQECRLGLTEHPLSTWHQAIALMSVSLCLKSPHPVPSLFPRLAALVPLGPPTTFVTWYPRAHVPSSVIPHPLPSTVSRPSSEFCPLFHQTFLSVSLRSGGDAHLWPAPLGDHPPSPSCKNSWASEAQLCSCLTLSFFLFEPSPAFLTAPLSPNSRLIFWQIHYSCYFLKIYNYSYAPRRLIERIQ